MIFMKFHFSEENGVPFCPKLKTARKPYVFHRFFHAFFSKSHFSAKKQFWGPKTWNFMKFPKFHPFSLNFPILGHFTGSWISWIVGHFPGLCFKAKKVRFRDIFHVLRKMELFGSKTWFLPKFSSRGEKSIPGLQKRAQNLTFIKGFARGARWGPKNLKRAVLHPKTHFWGPGPPWGPCLFTNL